MADILAGKLQTQALPVDDLVASVIEGQIRIPSFQRGLRWQRSDVIKLFDSIVRGYPIGNLLLWRRSANAAPDLRVGALAINAPSMKQALFVVDGQQRLTSLSNALVEQGHQDPRFALAYDVFKEQFVPVSGQSVYEIPLPVIFDLTKLLTWYRDHSTLTDDPLLVDRANSVAKAIREFRVPVYIVDQPNVDVLRDIFDRMNNYGKKLTRAEVFSALHESGSGEKTDDGALGDLSSISAQVHAATGFGIVDDDTILLAMLARRGSDISRDIRREFDVDAGPNSQRIPLEFPGESPAAARELATEAMKSAIWFLQTDAGAPHFAFLPYRYLLVVLTRFFAHFPDPDAASRRNLRRWFWRAASRGPELTRGNITYAARSLCARIVPGDEQGSIHGLLALVGDEPSSIPDVSQFRTNYAATRLMVAAMWSLRPRPLAIAGERDSYSQEDLLNVLGEGNSTVGIALPLFRSTELPGTESALAANRVLALDTGDGLPDSVVDALRGIAHAAAYGSDAARLVLQSHALSEESSAQLRNGDRSSFIRSRQQDLVKLLETFLTRNTEWAFEDTPSLASLDLDTEEAEERDDAFRVRLDGF